MSLSPSPTTPPSRLRRWIVDIGSRIGVRARSVLVAVVVVCVALLIGESALVWMLQSNLEQTAEANAQARASEIVTQLTTDGLAATREEIADRTRHNSVVQILDDRGNVLVASSADVSRQPLSPQRPAPGAYESVETDHLSAGSDGEWKVVTTAVRLDSTLYYVQSAVPVGEQHETIEIVAMFLLAGAPLLLGAVALAVWLLVGRALRSVEQIRGTVAEIDAQRLAQRVTVPPTRDEIAALATTMNTMLDRLEASDRAQRAFVSDASHELRSPVATLSTAGELAATADPARRAALLATMNTEIARLRGLVEDLMTLARADARDLGIPRAEVDLDDLVADEARRLRLTNSVVVTAAIEPVRVLGDQRRLEQALRNLIDNAARHASTTVRLTLTSTATEAIIWVDDDGPGIPVADRDRIFDRFVRLDEARSRDQGGSGLGLAITRTTLRAHDGDASVVDSPDDWCRFEIRLPLVTESLDHSAGPRGCGN